ncbi:MAG: SRPBCC family protein [Candidatus Andeanibacterium colombiense]|uniref:SRPBCC family protein n=1 Tax=Candidatus Andeanibacterium colombiense TaxID=3121345 RepID=A0AAJ5XBW0_9SPHN|nr:MAG: SRPBCC family protein [Sphingomonadaceae bacterium]
MQNTFAPEAFQEPAAAPHDDAPVTASKKANSSRALLEEAVTIARSPGELYHFWRDPLNLAAIMENITSIEPIDDRRSRWTVKAPAGKEVSWESVITEDIPGEQITWQSAEGADVANSGRIQFVDAGERGTVVRATIAYEPPAGVVGQIIAKMFQREPRIQTRRELRRFKQLMETGEIATNARNRRIAEAQKD